MTYTKHMTRLTIRVIPNASKSEIVGRELGVLKVRLAAPPVDGKANDALIALLSDHYDTPKSMIRIVKGHNAKTKIVELP